MSNALIILSISSILLVIYVFIKRRITANRIVRSKIQREQLRQRLKDMTKQIEQSKEAIQESKKEYEDAKKDFINWANSKPNSESSSSNRDGK